MSSSLQPRAPARAPAGRAPTGWRSMFVAILVAGAAAGGAAGCGSQAAPRPYPEPLAGELLGELAARNDQSRSFVAESVMDYWVGGERMKGSVLMMGQRGARIRLNALNPAGDMVAADLACNGEQFRFIDYNENCQLTGPCNRDSIARLLRVSLEPDDFLLLVMGSTPVIPAAEGEVTWDASRGHEILSLRSQSSSLTQTIVIDRRTRPWALISSVVRDGAGRELWSLQNKEFQTIEGAAGVRLRVPGKTLFKQPQHKADLLIRWTSRQLNRAIEPGKFQMDIPPGLPSCQEIAGPEAATEGRSGAAPAGAR